MSGKPIGPKVRTLLAHYIALEAVPPGGGIESGLNFLADAERREQGTRQAMANLAAALEAVKSAPDNPYGDDEEAIAAAILQKLEEVIKKTTHE